MEPHTSAGSHPASNPEKTAPPSRAGITPWPAPTDAPTLLFGGTFDPPHRAHIDLSIAARDDLFAADGWLVFVPAARNPHKPTQPIATDAQRVEMLRLATADADRVAVWTDEIDRGQQDEPSFWADTIVRARHELGPDTDLRFLIGADQAIAFHRWHNHDEILRHAEPAVMLRNPCPTRESFRSTLLCTGLDPAAWMPRLVKSAARPAASTDARDAIGLGNTPIDLLDPLVLGYIQLHGLYDDP